MTLPAVDSDRVAARLSLIRPHLDERAWRLLLSAEAKALSRGGIEVVAAAAAVHPDNVSRRPQFRPGVGLNYGLY
jgi:hypothetical protein